MLPLMGMATRTLMRSPFMAAKFAAKPVLKKAKNPFFAFDVVWGYDWMKKYKGNFNQRLMKTASTLDTMSKLVLIGGGLLGIAGAGAEIAGHLQRRIKARRTFEKVVKKDPYLSQLPREELEEYFETVKDISPTIASNPLLLRTTLKQMATYEGADPSSIRLLGEIEERTREPLIGPLYRLSDRLLTAGRSVPTNGER